LFKSLTGGCGILAAPGTETVVLDEDVADPEPPPQALSTNTDTAKPAAPIASNTARPARLRFTLGSLAPVTPDVLKERP